MGTFQQERSIATATGPISVAVGDLDGDGNLDLAVAGEGSGRGEVALLMGNGDATFQEVTPHLLVDELTVSIAASDLDGDGNTDLVAVNGTGSLTILWNEGGGNFGEREDFLAAPNPAAIEIADIDGDGVPDAIVANDTPGRIILLSQ